MTTSRHFVSTSLVSSSLSTFVHILFKMKLEDHFGFKLCQEGSYRYFEVSVTRLAKRDLYGQIAGMKKYTEETVAKIARWVLTIF